MLDEILCGISWEKTNIYENPDGDSSIVKTIEAKTNLMVYLNESTENFYKICTESGREGFCKKENVMFLA